MATKKKATDVVVAKSTSMVDIHAQLSQEAAESIKTKIAAPSGDFIRVSQDKKFVLPNGTKLDRLTVVILDFVSSNQFFDKAFKKGEESPPACFAIGESVKGLVPDTTSPVIQSKIGCDVCPNNVFGSKGAGKACSNLRLLAVTEASDDPQAPINLMKVSSTAIKAFDAYVGTLRSEFDTVPVGVVTDIFFDAGLDYPSLRFGNPVPNENLAVHMPRRAGAKARLLRPLDVTKYGQKATKAKGKR